MASDIQSRVNRYSRHVLREIGEGNIVDVRIKWVDSTTPEAFFKQDKLTIRMDCSENSHRNLVLATYYYVSSTVAREGRPYLDPKLREALDLTCTKKILDSEAREFEKSYFDNTYLFPKLEADRELQQDCLGLTHIDNKGYFTRLFLRELRAIGVLLEGSIPTDEVRAELRDFYLFLFRLANSPIAHEGGEPLAPEQFRFRRRYLNIQVVLLAVYANVESENLRPYRRRIKDGLQNGIQTFYLIAGAPSFAFLEKVQEDIQHRLVRQNILRLTCDRTFLMRRSFQRKEKDPHRCLIYQRTGAVDTNTELVLERLFGDEIPDTEKSLEA